MEDQVLISDPPSIGRRRGLALALAAVVAVTLLACGGSGDDDTVAGSSAPTPVAAETTSPSTTTTEAPTSSSAAPSTTAPTGSTEDVTSVAPSSAPAAGLADGYYRTSVSSRNELVAAAVAHGVSEADATAALDGIGIAESAAATLRIDDGRWTVYASVDGVPPHPVWRGSYEVLDADTITTTDFAVPFDVILPAWVAPGPSTEDPNFVTWEGATEDRAIRFLVPVNVYPPGSPTPQPVPEDYGAYLLAQEANGAEFTDVVETTVGGRPATLLTANTPGSIDGSLGCPADGISAAECFGLQPEVTARIAVVELDGAPVLIWLRDVHRPDGRNLELRTFDAMLASIDFRNS